MALSPQRCRARATRAEDEAPDAGAAPGDPVLGVGGPVIGRMPKHRQAAEHPLVTLDEPSSDGAEAFGRLRATFRAAAIDGGRRSLVVSSAVPAEGKTFVAANLAVAFAVAGPRVAAGDTNLRAPRLAQVFGVSATDGLTGVLLREVPVDEGLHRYDSLSLQ